MKPKISLLACLILWTAISLSGQSNIAIQGTILDSLTQKTISFATVAIFDTAKTPLYTAFSDDNGAFKFNNLVQGKKYRIEVACIGYAPKVLKEVFEETPMTILLKPTTNELTALTVTAQKPVLEQKGNKLVYNAANDLTNTGATSLELLQKIPYVSVDGDDNVRVKGSDKFLIKLNGRKTGLFSNNPKEALRGFPANSILKVEITTNPSAKDDAEGATAIINIITKKRMSGYNGSLGGSYNTLHRINYNTSIEAKLDKLGLSAYYGGNQQNGFTTYSSSFQGTNLQTNPNYMLTDNKNNTSNRWQWGNVEIAYDIDSMQTVSVYGSLNGGANEQTGSTNVAFQNAANETISRAKWDNITKYAYPSWDLGADYLVKIKEDQEFSLSLAYENSNNDGYSGSQQDYTSYRRWVINDNKGNNQETTVETNYSHPINPKNSFSVGLKGIYRDIKADYANLLYNFTTNDYVILPEQSNILNYKQYVYGGYAEYVYKVGKFSFQPGARFEQTLINANFVSSNQTIHQNYGTFIPTIDIRYEIKPMQSLALNYSRSISRPSLWYLNPAVLNSNPQAVSKGNPDLAPELTQNYSLEYSLFKNGTNLILGITDRYTTNVINSITTNQADNSTFTTYYNTGTNNYTGININLSGTIIKKLSYNVSFEAGYNLLQGFSGDKKIRNTGYTGWGRGNLSYKFPKEWSASMNGHLGLGQVGLQNNSTGWRGHSFSVNKTLLNKKLRFRAFIDNPFMKQLLVTSTTQSNDFIRQNTNIRPTRAFGIGINYSFGKLKESVSRKKGVKNNDTKSGGGNGG